MKLVFSVFHLIVSFWGLVAAGIFSCGEDDKSCLSSFFNSSSVLGAFLGDHGTVIFQNALVKNTTACPAMSVIFARGTAEPGESFVHVDYISCCCIEVQVSTNVWKATLVSLLVHRSSLL